MFDRKTFERKPHNAKEPIPFDARKAHCPIEPHHKPHMPGKCDAHRPPEPKGPLPLPILPPPIPVPLCFRPHKPMLPFRPHHRRPRFPKMF